MIKCPHCNAEYPHLMQKLMALTNGKRLPCQCGYCNKTFYIEFIVTIKVSKNDPSSVPNISDK